MKEHASSGRNQHFSPLLSTHAAVTAETPRWSISVPASAIACKPPALKAANSPSAHRPDPFIKLATSACRLVGVVISRQKRSASPRSSLSDDAQAHARRVPRHEHLSAPAPAWESVLFAQCRTRQRAVSSSCSCDRARSWAHEGTSSRRGS